MSIDTDLYQALGRLEAKVDLLLQDRQDLEARVGSLERWRSWLAGAWAILAVGLSWIGLTR
jgi:hypothetical protein